MNFRGSMPAHLKGANDFTAIFHPRDYRLLEDAYRGNVESRTKFRARMEFVAMELELDYSQVVHSLKSNSIAALHNAADRYWRRNQHRLPDGKVKRNELTPFQKHLLNIRALASLTRNDFKSRVGEAWGRACMLGQAAPDGD